MTKFFSCTSGGFYDDVIHGRDIPEDAVEIDDSAYQDLFAAQSAGKRIIPAPTGHPIAVDPPPPTTDEKRAAFTAAIQQHLDTTARRLGYDDIRSAVTYAEEPAVAKFQSEGRALRAWRSLVWAAGYELMDEVLRGERSEPSIDELLALLPALAP